MVATAGVDDSVDIVDEIRTIARANQRFDESCELLAISQFSFWETREGLSLMLVYLHSWTPVRTNGVTTWNESVITMLCGIRDLGNFSNNGIVNLPKQTARVKEGKDSIQYIFSYYWWMSQWVKYGLRSKVSTYDQ